MSTETADRLNVTPSRSRSMGPNERWSTSHVVAWARMMRSRRSTDAEAGTIPPGAIAFFPMLQFPLTGTTTPRTCGGPSGVPPASLTVPLTMPSAKTSVPRARKRVTVSVPLNVAPVGLVATSGSVRAGVSGGFAVAPPRGTRDARSITTITGLSCARVIEASFALSRPTIAPLLFHVVPRTRRRSVRRGRKHSATEFCESWSWAVGSGKGGAVACPAPLRSSADEGGPEREREAQHGEPDAGRGQQLIEARLVAVLGQRQPEAGREAADEAAGVGDVVDAFHQEAHHEQEQRPLAVLPQDHGSERPTALLAEGHHRAPQAEHRAGDAGGEAGAE